MTPHNMVPSRVPRQVQYTDGTPSREVEDDENWDVEDKEEMKKLKEGFAYRKPSSALQLRDRLINVIELVEVARISLLSKENNPLKVANVLYFNVTTELEEIEKELARL